MAIRIGQGKRVLLIEDDPVQRLIYAGYLQQMGFEVIQRALFTDVNNDVVAIGKVDLILSDNNTYGNDIVSTRENHDRHIQCTDWLPGFRDIENNPNVDTPVVLYTDTHEPERRILQALDAGIQGFLHKSFATLGSGEAATVVAGVLEGQGREGGKMLASPKMIRSLRDGREADIRAGRITAEEAKKIGSSLAMSRRCIYADVGNGGAVEVPWDHLLTSEIRDRVLPVVSKKVNSVMPAHEIAAVALFFNALGDVVNEMSTPEKDRIVQGVSDHLQDHLQDPPRKPLRSPFIETMVDFFVNAGSDIDVQERRQVLDEVFYRVMRIAGDNRYNEVSAVRLINYGVELYRKHDLEKIEDVEVDASTILSHNPRAKYAGSALVAAMVDNGEKNLREFAATAGGLTRLAAKVQNAIGEVEGIKTIMDYGINLE